MPFLAESIYRGIGGAKESVHLEDWPLPRRRAFFARLFGKESTLPKMAAARRIVSNALEARSAAKIRVRQPLSKLTVPLKALPPSRDRDTLLSIIAEEVNVKEVVLDPNLNDDEVQLDTILTDALREEGFVREFIRAVQSARKEAGLNPRDVVDLSLHVSENVRTIIEKHKTDICTSVNVHNVGFSKEPLPDEFLIDQGKVSYKLQARS
ncbi:MAG: Isoleucine-tRNA ligase [Parcubacteria group bacterium GW2011_GWA2_51_10]|nr:MAG: Isoleucine-tRNA ligase [Parcubacteria group bacterium GW2011_GWA2_51_10]